ncbi:GNAT family N-acetyltransferase [Vibrio ziniensis]|uniref:GNAT family N-acetyltransferase n=1 Tax=Vibrio ziniensis TaxID=2711221 RepID=A0A6G7CMQ7_9VIBR|nr:GNAT family N-acetyltransferase [Vibrio ziniensis]QIH43417.1 GNAT family N-acetyltransferase [Vibrio ziniensis]
MVFIEKYSPIWQQEASYLSVREEQAQFTIGNIPQVVEQLKETEHPHLIIFEDKPVGFFLLDLDYSTKYQFGSQKAIGIRALLVDQHYQGKGIATKVIKALPSYVAKHYPDFEVMQLTVNCRNKPAYECYLKCGFADTGELYLGGPVGPQHIMQYVL